MDDEAMKMLESHRRFTKERLAAQVQILLDRMDRVLQMLENEEDPIISICGEVQGLGAAVDTRCAEYAVVRDLIKEYAGRKAAMEEQAGRKGK